MNIRKMQDVDWDRVMQIQAQAYPVELLESKETLQAKQRISSDTCFVVEIDQDIAGYFLSVPYQLGQPPPLNSQDKGATATGNLHIHDFCLSVAHRKHGYGRKIVNKLLVSSAFASFKTASVVSVMCSRPFWESLGFSHFDSGKGVDLSSYGQQASYLCMELT